MPYILGIDTGGTYTDAVIIRSENGGIINKSKALTTPNDLSKGIGYAIKNLGEINTSIIDMVSISTTLATNAVVEGKGGRVGLLYFGDEPEGEMPASMRIRIRGGLDINGNILENIDRKEIMKVVESMKGKVEAIAVSGYAGVRNPEMEQGVREIIRTVSSIPVVCGHELTTQLGYYQRTLTAVLNAMLLPIVEELFCSIRKVLDNFKISAPVMVVRGDGTLMTEEAAMEKPVDTILSGPAASITGGAFLSGLKDGIILDMGGTTTDIAHMKNGSVRIESKGAKVGGWLTRVRAAQISTFGIGGDSWICLDKKGQIQVGPQRAIPLSLAGLRYPNLIREMKSFRLYGEIPEISKNEATCYVFVKNLESGSLGEEEERILTFLKDEPKCINQIGDHLNKSPEFINMEPLVEAGYLMRIGLTPTDLLHIQGKYREWDQVLPQKAAEILSERSGISLNTFIKRAMDNITRKLGTAFLQSMADFEGEEELILTQSKESEFLLDKLLGQNALSPIKIKAEITEPLVVIGAPSGAWAPALGRVIGGDIQVPYYADVANAIGAAVGKSVEKVEILLLKKENNYIVIFPWERQIYKSLEEAEFYAIHEGRKHIEKLMTKNCVFHWHIDEQHEKIYGTNKGDSGDYMGRKIIITGISS